MEVCNEIEGQKKLLVPKFDNLQKHVGTIVRSHDMNALWYNTS
jgi:hypothetical protein